jgi:hypothetical protein
MNGGCRIASAKAVNVKLVSGFQSALNRIQSGLDPGQSDLIRVNGKFFFKAGKPYGMGASFWPEPELRPISAVL